MTSTELHTCRAYLRILVSKVLHYIPHYTIHVVQGVVSFCLLNVPCCLCVH